MCGICGVATWNADLPADAETRVEAMVSTLLHRGPNGHARSAGRAAMFGVTRLSIRGVDNGTQPIVDTGSGVMMACNGEIDNHRQLRELLTGEGRDIPTSSDVGVILPLYLKFGENFINHLYGAFAIAIWDPRLQTLLLARDRTGERPLFYQRKENKIVFASLISALVNPNQNSEAINIDALRGYMQSGYFRAPATPFISVEKISPGEIVRIDAQGVHKRRYWRWSINNTFKQPVNASDFDGIFRTAVEKQSDVEVNFGLFLSGGVDSSLVAAVTRSLYPDKPLNAYSLRFKEDSYDEGQYADRVAEILRLNMVPVWVNVEDFPAGIKHLIRLSGEPLADPAWVPSALLAKRAARDVPMALIGEGADEVFAGYPTYFGAGLAERYNLLPAKLRTLLRWVVTHWPPSDKKVTLSFMLKRFVQGDNLHYLSRHRLWTSSISPELLNRLNFLVEPDRYLCNASESKLDCIQMYDLENSLAEGLLTKADRGSMSSAVELRSPFLDEAVLRFAAGLPKSQRINGLQTKVFLKQYALRYLPESIVYRKKRGLSVPLSSWLQGPLHQWARSKLRHPLLEELGIDTHAAIELLNDHCRRKNDHARTIWTLAVLSEWLEWKAGGDNYE